MTDSGKRRLTSWIDSFCEYSAGLYVPSIFSKWAGISIVSGALERKVWTFTRGGNLYPNLYILLVGPPGSGKSHIIREVNRFWYTLVPDFHIAPISVTKSSLLDSLNEANRKIVRPTENPPYIEFKSLQAAVTEFSDFAPMYDPTFMSLLQTLYDCEEFPFTERRRTKDLNIKISNPQLGMIGGTTPSYLNTWMPEGAWDQGFISRTILIYSGETAIINLFEAEARPKGLMDDLKADLKLIHSLYGKIEWSKEGAEMVQAWVNGLEQPIPEHRKLMHYSTRRKAHIIKLCIIASVSRRSDLIIMPEDVRLAFDWLFEAEHFMPDIFKAMASGGDADVLHDTWQYVWSDYAVKKKPMSESRICSFIAERVPSHSVDTILKLMIRMNMIKQDSVGNTSGQNTYSPVPKQMQGI